MAIDPTDLQPWVQIQYEEEGLWVDDLDLIYTADLDGGLIEADRAGLRARGYRTRLVTCTPSEVDEPTPA